MRKALIFFAVVMIASFRVSGQETKTVSAMATADDERFIALRRSGLDGLYNLDYERARKDFSELARLYPNHPAGPQLLAARLWIKTLYESRRLQTSLYSSDSFYTHGDDQVDPKIVNEFRGLTREAKRLADIRLKANPKDIEALEFLGATAGLKASFEEAVERRHFAAIRDGSDAVDYYREVLKLNPNYVDAELTIGLYEYVVGSLPLPQKILAGISGHRGSRKKGLSMLEQVAKEGRWSNDDAKSLLILLYSREQRFNDALAQARALSAKYPRNYLFRLEIADALAAQAAKDRRAGNNLEADRAEQEAFKTFEDLLRDHSVRETVSHALDLVHFKYGEVLLTAGQGERAAAEFVAATRVEGGASTLVTMAHLYAGHGFDLAGKRNEALTHYRVVLTRPDIDDAHEEAKKGLREPYRNDLKQALNTDDGGE